MTGFSFCWIILLRTHRLSIYDNKQKHLPWVLWCSSGFRSNDTASMLSLSPSVIISCEKKHNLRLWHIFKGTKQTAKQIHIHKSTIKHVRQRKSSTPPHWRLRGELGTGQVVSTNLGVRRDWGFIIDGIPCGALLWNSICVNFSLCSFSKEMNWDRMSITLALIKLNPLLKQVKY